MYAIPPIPRYLFLSLLDERSSNPHFSLHRTRMFRPHSPPPLRRIICMPSRRARRSITRSSTAHTKSHKVRRTARSRRATRGRSRVLRSSNGGCSRLCCYVNHVSQSGGGVRQTGYEVVGHSAALEESVVVFFLWVLITCGDFSYAY